MNIVLLYSTERKDKHAFYWDVLSAPLPRKLDKPPPRNHGERMNALRRLTPSALAICIAAASPASAENPSINKGTTAVKTAIAQALEFSNAAKTDGGGFAPAALAPALKAASNSLATAAQSAKETGAILDRIPAEIWEVIPAAAIDGMNLYFASVNLDRAASGIRDAVESPAAKTGTKADAGLADLAIKRLQVAESALTSAESELKAMADELDRSGRAAGWLATGLGECAEDLRKAAADLAPIKAVVAAQREQIETGKR